MHAGFRKAVGLGVPLILVAIWMSACGSGDEATTTTKAAPPAVSRETADHLAKLSNRVASDLDAGETCSAAVAADELKAAVDDSDLPATVRPGVETVATDLVNQVNCPPPPPPPQPEKPEKKPKKPEEPKPDDHGENHGNGNGPGDHGPGNSDHGGFVPPGHAKLEGEQR